MRGWASTRELPGPGTASWEPANAVGGVENVGAEASGREVGGPMVMVVPPEPVEGSEVWELRAATGGGPDGRPWGTAEWGAVPV